MKTFHPTLTISDVLLFGLAYLLWLINVAVCMVAVIQFRSTVNVLWVALGGNRYSLGLVNQLALLIGGFIAFGYAVFLESQYRASVAPRTGNALPQRLTDSRLGILLRRFVITTAIPLGIAVISLVILEIALRIL